MEAQQPDDKHRKQLQAKAMLMKVAIQQRMKEVKQHLKEDNQQLKSSIIGK